MNPETIHHLQELDRRHHIHPFTDHVAMHEKGTSIITGGEGCYIFDASGRKLLDGLAGLWCVNIGYGNKELARKIAAQVESLAYYTSFFNSTTEPAIRLAAKLAELAPKRINRTMFCNSGSEANETALKLIRGYYAIQGRPEKNKIVTRNYSYHGVGMASGSLTALETCNKPFNLPLDGFVRVPGPYAYAAGKDDDEVAYGQYCIEETARIIAKEGPEKIAAFFVEPVQGAGGVIPPPPGYLKALRELCRKNDILFVADEVITGFGRLGHWFASEAWELDPDMICFAKGVTSGYIPLGGTMISDEMSDTLMKGGYLAHGFTYSGHPVACAAGLANLEIVEREQLCEKVRNKSAEYFQSKLGALRSHPAVGQVRGTGLMAAIELLPPGGRKDLNPALKLGVKAFQIAREEGFMVRGIGNMMAVSPALIITNDEIDLLVGGIKKTLDKLWK